MLTTYGPLRLIRKDDETVVGQIPGTTEKVVRAWYSQTDRSDNGDAGDAIREIHGQGLWIACNCRPLDELPPILVPVMHERTFGKMTLRRQVDRDDDRPDHHIECEFRADFDRAETLEREQRQRQMRKRAMGLPWAIPADRQKATAFLLREERASRDPGPSGRRQSTLAGELWRIMWAARVEYLEKAVGSTMKQEMRKVIDGIGRIPHAVFDSLGGISTTYPSDISGPGSRWLDRVSAISGWPAGAKPTAYACILADDVSGGVVSTPGLGPIKVENGIGQPSQGGKPIPGPYLVTIACEIGGGKARPHIAYAQPVVSRDCLAPVDSQFERLLCKGALTALAALRKKRPDLEVRLRKEASSRETPLGICKPDFVCQVESPGGKAKFVIEAMGYEDATYLASKAVTHPIMEEVGPVETIAYRDVKTPADATRAIKDLILKHAP